MVKDKILSLSEIVMGIWRRDSETVFQLSTQLAESRSEVAKLEQALRELGEMLATVKHLKKWARPSMGFSGRQAQDAVIRICDDALSKLSDETKQIVKELK